MGIPEGEKKEKGIENLSVIAESLPNMGKELGMQVQEAKRIITSMQKPCLRHILLNFQKSMTKILKFSQEKKRMLIYHGQCRQHIKKQRRYFANKGPSSQGYGFSSSHVWM